MICAHESAAVGDLLGARDLESLALLDGLNESGGLDERVMSSGIEPGDSPAHDFGVQLSPHHVGPVHICNFKLTAGRGLKVSDNLYHLFVVKIQTGDRQTGFRMRRFLFQSHRAPLTIQLDYSVSLRILDLIRKNGSSMRAVTCVSHHRGQLMTVEDVVSQDERTGTTHNELAANNECLS